LFIAIILLVCSILNGKGSKNDFKGWDANVFGNLKKEKKTYW
jgi:hypothetical protein